MSWLGAVSAQSETALDERVKNNVSLRRIAEGSFKAS